MTEPEFEAAMTALERLATLPSVTARLAFNDAPFELIERADRVLRLTMRVLDDVGVLTEMDAIDGLIRKWAANREGKK